MQIERSVVVVTGASSGIGRASALLLAERGATVVGVARDGAALAELAGRHGIHAAPADVADAAAVSAVADRTIERFGRIDAWVNCAGVIAFGGFLDVPLDEIRRVLDVDLMGYVHGCRAALPGMVERGEGVVVNVSSILGILPLPYGSAYTMAKFAIRGLGGSLRHELRGSGVPGVRVATVLPAAVDTPIWADGGNRTGLVPRITPPTYSPERVARAVVAQVRRPRREVVVGGVLVRGLLGLHRVAPALAERLLAEEVTRYGYRPDPAPDGPGTVFDPPTGPRQVHGGWDGPGRERRRRAVAAGAAAVGTLAAGGLAVHRARGGAA